MSPPAADAPQGVKGEAAPRTTGKGKGKGKATADAGKGKGKGKGKGAGSAPRRRIRRPKKASPPEPDVYEVAAMQIMNADIMLFACGAGMSVDSGLLLWSEIPKIPAYAELDYDYEVLGDPNLFNKDTNGAYGFWGWNFNQYMDTEPHSGYDIVARWKNNLFVGEKAEGRTKPMNLDAKVKELKLSRGKKDDFLLRKKPARKPPAWRGNFFVVTTNIDMSFLKVGFRQPEVSEIHGSLLRWQCTVPCKQVTWELQPDDFRFEVDSRTMRAPLFKNDSLRPGSTTAATPEPPSAPKDPRNEHEEGCQCSDHVRYFAPTSKTHELTVEEISKYRHDNQLWVAPKDQTYQTLTAPRSARGSSRGGAQSGRPLSRPSTPPANVAFEPAAKTNPKVLMHQRVPKPSRPRSAGARSDGEDDDAASIAPPAPDNYHFPGIFSFQDADYYMHRLASRQSSRGSPRGGQTSPRSATVPGLELPAQGSITQAALHHELAADSPGRHSQRARLQALTTEASIDGAHTLLSDIARQHPDPIMRSPYAKEQAMDSKQRVRERPGTASFDFGDTISGDGGDSTFRGDSADEHQDPDFLPGCLYYGPDHFSSYLNSTGVKMMRQNAPSPPPIPPDPQRNHPRCVNPDCKANARPNILLNDKDRNFVPQRSHMLYKRFMMNIRKIVKADPSKRVVIVEVGSSPKMTRDGSLRKITEDFHRQLGENSHFIRIDPEYSEINVGEEDRNTVIRDRAHPALKTINQYVEGTLADIENTLAKYEKK